MQVTFGVLDQVLPLNDIRKKSLGLHSGEEVMSPDSVSHCPDTLTGIRLVVAGVGRMMGQRFHLKTPDWYLKLVLLKI